MVYHKYIDVSLFSLILWILLNFGVKATLNLTRHNKKTYRQNMSYSHQLIVKVWLERGDEFVPMGTQGSWGPLLAKFINDTSDSQLNWADNMAQFRPFL